MKLSAQARDILAQGRDALEPTAEQRTRVRAGIDARVAAGGAIAAVATLAATETTAGASAATGAAGVGVLGKTIAVSALVLATTAGGVAYHRSRSAQQSFEVRRPTAAKPAPRPTRPHRPEHISVPAVVPESDAKATQPARPAPPRHVRRRSSDHPATRLGREAALLQRARKAIDQDQIAKAHTLLDSYARTFPNGQLAREADKLRRLLSDSQPPPRIGKQPPAAPR